VVTSIFLSISLSNQRNGNMHFVKKRPNRFSRYDICWVRPDKQSINREQICTSRAAVVNLNFRAGSTFPVPVCTVPSSMDRTIWCNKVDAVRLYASYRLNLLLLKGQRCVVLTYPDSAVLI